MQRSYSEGEPLSNEKITAALEPDFARYAQGSGYGVAAFAVPALPGHYVVHLVNEEGEKLRFLTTHTVRALAGSDVASRDISAEIKIFEEIIDNETQEV